MRSSSRAIGLFFFSAIATSIFIVFNLTGIFNMHWAYVLVPMYLQMLLMVAYYYVFVRRVFSKKKDYSDDSFDNSEFETVQKLEIIREASAKVFSDRINEIYRMSDFIRIEYSHTQGNYIAFITSEQRIKK